MPFYLKESDDLLQAAELGSVLIVPCRFCPAASQAVRENKPYLEPLRKFLRTEAYESYIQALRSQLEEGGVRTAVFDSKILHQFVACMWTSKRRAHLAKRASEFDGLVVLGCDAMVETVRESVKDTGCPVIQAMEIEGLMNVLPTVSFPMKLTLSLHGLTPITSPRSARSSEGAA